MSLNHVESTVVALGIPKCDMPLLRIIPGETELSGRIYKDLLMTQKWIPTGC